MSGFARGILVGTAATVVVAASVAAVTPLSFQGEQAEAQVKQPLWHEKRGGAQQAAVAQPSFAPLVKQLKPAVVSVSTRSIVATRPRGHDPFEEFFRRFMGEPPMRREGDSNKRVMPRSMGSGFVIHESGLVLTNNHVIERADEIQVKLADGREFAAEVVGRDPKTDVAMLRLQNASDLPTAFLGDSDALEVGDWVLAIGNPFGLSHSVSTGIVSAKERFIGAGPYDDFIQTDAAINPGNSGGPLFNIHGEVIGINTAIVAHGQGIGFAVPINLVKALIPQLEEKGQVSRGWLGVVIQDVNETLASTLGLKKAQGALIAEVVAGGPAEQAGLRPADVVVSVDGKRIEGYAQLSRTIALLAPGSNVAIGVIRDGKEMTLHVTISERDDDWNVSPARGEGPGAPKGEADQLLGLTVRDLPQESARHLGRDGGVLIAAVEAGSPAAKAGLNAGDVLLEINRRPVRSLGDYREVMRNISAGEMVLLRLQRGESAIYVAVRAGR
jgi:serine protease Do